MESGSILHDSSIQLPQSFFDVIIQDISPPVWLRLFQINPNLRDTVLEGFSGRSNRLPKILRQPHIMARIRKELKQDPELLDDILQLWAREKLSLMAFLEMLHPDFVHGNFTQLKNLVGPERFLAALHVLEFASAKEYPNDWAENFWERTIDPEVLDPLLPIFDLWRELVQENPDLAGWMETLMEPSAQGESREKPAPKENHAPPQAATRTAKEDELRKRFERKLAITREEIHSLREQRQRYKSEAEELRKNLTRLQENFQQELSKALQAQHDAWYSRFQEVNLAPLDESETRLDQVLERARRAMELQREADEKYGIVTAVRRKFMDLTRMLEEMDKIHDQSMFVHQEVIKVKGELQKEKQRLMQTPGMEKVLKTLPAGITSESLGQHIRLLEPSLESLPRLSRLKEILQQMETVGFPDNAEPLYDAVQAKKHQILAHIYGRFQPPGRDGDDATPTAFLPDFEDFVRSGQSRNHEIYVDGYNLLLNAPGSERPSAAAPLAELREELIAAICRKSSLFKKVHLVFDGTGFSRNQILNTEITYTDKFLGEDADNHLIQAIGRRKDRTALLVTADREIIDAVERKVFALLDPRHFYAFVFDLDFPFPV